MDDLREKLPLICTFLDSLENCESPGDRDLENLSNCDELDPCVSHKQLISTRSRYTLVSESVRMGIEKRVGTCNHRMKN